MALSGTSNTFTVNQREVITMAMKVIGKLGQNEPVNTSDYADLSMLLNMIVKQYQGNSDFSTGLKTWTRKTGYLFLDNTTGTYQAGPTGSHWTTNPNITTTSATSNAADTTITVESVTGMSATDNIAVQDSTGNLFWTTIVSILGTTITLTDALTSAVALNAAVFSYALADQGSTPIVTESVFLRDDTDTDTPVWFMTLQTYSTISNKDDPQNIADPNMVYVERNLDYTTYFTNVGAALDTSKYLVVKYMKEVDDLLEQTDNLEYTKEWYLALVWALAKQAAPLFNVLWDDIRESNYKTAMMIAKNVEPQTTQIYFQCNA